MATNGLLSSGGALFPSAVRGPAGNLPSGQGIYKYIVIIRIIFQNIHFFIMQFYNSFNKSILLLS